MDLHAKDARAYTVTVLCRLLGVSKQAYFKRDESSVMKKAARESFAIEYIRNVMEKDPGFPFALKFDFGKGESYFSKGKAEK